MPYKNSWGEKARVRSQKRNEYFNEYRKRREKKKVHARYLVAQAIRKGDIKPLPCERFSIKCGGRVEGHHDNYDNPLSVMWLCSFHHRERHGEIAPIEVRKGLCLNCGTEITFPKKKYCSDYCGLVGWRKNL